jgi:hypothetical protein
MDRKWIGKSNTRLARRVIDLSKIKHVTLHYPPSTNSNIFHYAPVEMLYAPVAMLFTVFLSLAAPRYLPNIFVK